MTTALQPYLHDLIGIVAAPTQIWSTSGGELGANDGRLGLIHSDVRLLSRLALTVDGVPPAPIHVAVHGRSARFAAVARNLQDPAIEGQDPRVRINRTRTVTAGRLTETVEMLSHLDRPVATHLTVDVGCGAVPVDELKAGGLVDRAGPVHADGQQRVHWFGAGAEAFLEVDVGKVTVIDSGCRIDLPVTLDPGRPIALTITLTLTDTESPYTAPASPPLPIGQMIAEARQHQTVLQRQPVVQMWLRQSLEDLDSLRLARRGHPEEVFFAAGAPWYLALFGRDSLWAARLLLPLHRATAWTTLTALARLQGISNDPVTEEHPGKIIHELRRRATAFLPARYWGTVDATSLWVCLLYETWSAGQPDEDVEMLVPQLQAALAWIGSRNADADGDGLIEYINDTGKGLTNQGWKDSQDSIRFHDGTIASGPVALCEVQGYAVQALRNGGVLLDHFNQPGSHECRVGADRIENRFRAAFWDTADPARGPALALDGAKRRVDSVTSNIGHLLGTGILTADEERIVADRLVIDDMDSGHGLRTMSSADSGFNPTSYHCGSVWAHDTAITIRGLLAAGYPKHAHQIAHGLLRAAIAFRGRLPELWSGEAEPGVPYPAACRPQAWAAAAVVPALNALADAEVQVADERSS